MCIEVERTPRNRAREFEISVQFVRRERVPVGGFRGVVEDNQQRGSVACSGVNTLSDYDELLSGFGIGALWWLRRLPFDFSMLPSV